MLSSIGRVNEAPVDAEMRTMVSKVFHVGKLPKGPVIKARTFEREV